MGIEVIISALIANVFTSFSKPGKSHSFTEEDQAARKTVIRIMNAVFALIALVATSWISGESLNVSEASGLAESLVTLIVTFLTGQGGYALIKGWFK